MIDDGEGIALSGPPRNMSGLVPLDVPRSTIVPISIRLGDGATVYRAVARPTANATSELRLRLPADTAPGRYAGEATIEGKPRRITLVVDPVLRIRIHPKQTRVTAAAGASASFAITVINDGNVPFEIPQSDRFDLDDPVVQDRAMGKTLRATLARGESRMDHLFEELRQGHAGEATLSVRSGAGRLQPGESRELACVLQVPATAPGGHSYTGAWRLANVAHPIVADVATTASPNHGRAKG
jgi:hypothetical protein